MSKLAHHARRAAAKSATSPASGPIFEVRNLAIGFDEREDVLHNVTMQVEPGEFVVLLGPSGCGKTTILNLAAGLLSPRSGYVRFDGAEINGVNTNVGYMTQDDTLLPWMSVQANVGLPLRMRGVSKSETKAQVEHYLSLLDLSEAGSLFPSQLSGGMRRRALLARSMIYDPRLLLMDEPFAALDAQLRHQMHVELRRTVKKLNQTVVFVTHDIAEAAKLADRVLIVGGGRPGRLVAEFQVPYGDDRDLETIVYTDEYARFERELNEGLRGARDPNMPAV